MTNDRLTEAARVLRERAEAATPGPWRTRSENSRGWDKDDLTLYGEHGYLVRPGSHGGMFNEPADATFAATMHPGVALALADWLDTVSELHHIGNSPGPRVIGHALHIADLILGSAS